MTHLGETRVERKERTRRAILDAALELSEDTGLSGLSLRQVATRGRCGADGVLPALRLRRAGRAGAGRRVLRLDARDDARGPPGQRGPGQRHRTVRRGAGPLRARSGGTTSPSSRGNAPAARRRCGRRSGTSSSCSSAELATDIARLPAPNFSGSDLQVLANLIVGAVVRTVEDLLAADSRAAEERLLERARTQLRMVVIGALQWRSPGLE